MNKVYQKRKRQTKYIQKLHNKTAQHHGTASHLRHSAVFPHDDPGKGI